MAGELSARLGTEQAFSDFTRPEDRCTEYRFGADDLLVMASPVLEEHYTRRAEDIMI